MTTSSGKRRPTVLIFYKARVMRPMTGYPSIMINECDGMLKGDYLILSKKVGENNGRITDVETYVTGGKRRYAAVVVTNTGDAAKGWWWYPGLTGADVTKKLTENKARLFDIESYVSGGKRR